MGNFDKKYIVKKAENIVEEYNKKEKEERKEIMNLKKDYRKLKKINIVQKVIIALMAITIVVIAV